MLHKQNAQNAPENGSAIIYIFIGIALFGALMFMFSRGASQNTSSIADQQKSISASEIIDEARLFERAVQKVMSAGCSESDISFDPPPFTANTNTNSPSDKHCHVFYISGGGLSYGVFNSGWKFGAASTVSGSSSADLIAFIEGVDVSTCQKINDLLKNSFSSIPTETGSFISTAYNGIFAASPHNMTAANGKTSGCLNTDTHVPYVFFKTLLVR